MAPTPETPCSAAAAPDPAGDVTVQGSEDRARYQPAHADVDLVAAGLAGNCLALRTAGPLAPGFTIQVTDAGFHKTNISLIGGKLLVTDPTDEDHPARGLPGARAHLDPDGLVIALPITPAGKAEIAIFRTIGGIEYDDEARP